MTHGTYIGYVKDQCRCDECKVWKSQDNKRTVEKAQGRPRDCGTSSSYRYGCRCDDCKEAKRSENLRMNPRRKQAIRSERSLRSPKSQREYRLKTLYGLTLEEYEQMSCEQQGVCALCRRVEEGKRLAVDHCHKSGAVRALLCSRCNMALGLVQDDVDVLSRMVEYVEKHRKT